MSDFNNQKEIYEWLIAGNSVSSHRHEISIKLDSEGNQVDGNGKNLNYAFDRVDNWSKVIPEPKWYENIPVQGILCWCWDNDGNVQEVMVIKEYDANKEYCFRMNNLEDGFYRNAKPLSTDEVLSFIYLQSTQIKVN